MPEKPTVSLSKRGCSYEGPGLLAAGEITVRAVNDTTERFDIDLWLLESDGYDEFAAFIAEEHRRLQAGRPPLGHATVGEPLAELTAEAQRRGELIRRLAPGTYGIACIRFVGGVPAGIWAAGPFEVSPR